MANAFAQVDLSDRSRDFQRIALEPGVPLLDRTQSTARLLRVWLGRFIAEPEFVDSGIVQFYVDDEQGRRISAKDIQPIREHDLSGTLRKEVAELREKLSQIKPRGRTEERVLNVIRDRFEQFVADPHLARSDAALFKYRDQKGAWRLIWCWGYQRNQSLPAKPVLCPNAGCRRLYLVRKTVPPSCPKCETPMPVYRFPWKRVVAAMLFVVAVVGAGGWWYWQTLPRSSIAGQVFWRDFNAPVPEAEIAIPALKRTARSDAQGRFRLDRLPAGRCDLQITAPGFQTHQAQCELIRDQETSLPIELVGSDELTGRVLDAESHQPIRGAQIQIDGTSQSLTSDEAGQFRRSGCRGGTLKLIVSANGYPTVSREVTFSASTPLDLELTGDAILVGRVVTAAADKPVADVAVSLEGVGQSTKTDADGWFAFRKAPSGNQAVMIEADGYATQHIEKELASGQERQLVVKLAGAAKLNVTVTRAIDSAPLLGAEVRIPGTKFISKVDDNGRFELRGLMPQRTTIEVIAPGYATERLDRTLSETEDTVLSVKLQGEGLLLGRVMDGLLQQPVASIEVKLAGTPFRTTTDADGKFRLANVPTVPGKLEARASGYMAATTEVRPLANKEVAADLLLTGNAGIAGIIVERWSQEPLRDVTVQIANSQAKTTSAVDGTFEIKGLRGGTKHELLAAADGLSPKMESVNLGNGQLQQLKLVLSGEAKQSGRVVSAVDESPVAKARVQVAGSDHHAITDDKGQFTLEELRVGPVKLEVSASGFKSRLVEQAVTAESKPVSIVIGGDATVVGKITDAATRQPVSEVAVRIANTVLKAISDDKGRFRIEGAFSGDATFSLQASGYPPKEQTAELAAERKTELAFELAGNSSVSGEIVDDVNRPVNGAVIQLGDSDLKSITGESGEFDIDRLRAGSLQLTFSAENHARKSMTIELKPEETKALGQIVLPRSLTIRGEVRHALLHTPLPNAQITVAGQKTNATTDAKGHFELKDLPAGRTTLQVRATGFVGDRFTIEPNVADDMQPLYLCPELKTDEAVIVLTWRGDMELDAHLFRAQGNRATAHVHAGKTRDENLTAVIPADGRQIRTLRIQPLSPGRYEYVVEAPRLLGSSRGADAALALSRSSAEVRIYHRGSSEPRVFHVGRNKRAAVWQPFALEFLDSKKMIEHVYKAEHYQMTLPIEIAR